MWYSKLGKNLFLDIFSTNIDTPSLYQCVETHSTESFRLLSQPLPHLCFNLFVIIETFATQLSASLRDKHFALWTGNISLWISFCPQKKNRTTERCSSVVYTQARSPFWLLKPTSEHIHTLLLPGPSWSWTVLLPSDTHRNPIISITAVLLPFETYLLTLPRI
jgi:hypothetical protein